MNKKELVVKYRGLVSLACQIHNLRNVFRIKKIGNNNRIIAPCALMKKMNIRIKGSNNTVVIGDFAQLKGAAIYINGSFNHVTIGPWSYLGGTDLFIEDDGLTAEEFKCEMLSLKNELATLNAEATLLEATIEANIDGLFGE